MTLSGGRCQEASLYNSLYSVRSETKHDRIYKVETLSYSLEDGLINITGSQVPLTDDGKFEILQDWPNLKGSIKGNILLYWRRTNVNRHSSTEDCYSYESYYRPGQYPQSQFQATNGATTVVVWLAACYNSELTLTYANIRDERAQDLMQLYYDVNKDWNYQSWTTTPPACTRTTSVL